MEEKEESKLLKEKEKKKKAKKRSRGPYRKSLLARAEKNST